MSSSSSSLRSSDRDQSYNVDRDDDESALAVHFHGQRGTPSFGSGALDRNDDGFSACEDTVAADCTEADDLKNFESDFARCKSAGQEIEESTPEVPTVSTDDAAELSTVLSQHLLPLTESHGQREWDTADEMEASLLDALLAVADSMQDYAKGVWRS
jgi:hypothetical protein